MNRVITILTCPQRLVYRLITMDPGSLDPPPSDQPEGPEVAEAPGPGAPPPPKTPEAPRPAAPLGPPSVTRPRRPQRTPRVEGSVDVLEPKRDTGAETDPKPRPAGPHDDDEECTPDGPALSHPKPPAAGRTPADPRGLRTKGRAASVPYESAIRPPPPHFVPHAQRAFSVVGTADTPAQSLEDFRQVLCFLFISGEGTKSEGRL